MKKNALFVLLFLITTMSFAQDNYRDVVYLKNGSIIRGMIIEQIPNKSIKIQTAENNIFVYELNEVEKMTKEPYKRGKVIQEDNFYLYPGYKGIAELGYEIGVGDFGMDRLKINIINCYQVNQSFSIGIGTGLRYYFDAETTLVPVFADFRGNLLIDSKISPYISLGIGYSFNASESFKGAGFMMSPNVGISIKTSHNSSMNIAIGYELQKLDFFYQHRSDFYIATPNSDAISLNVSLSF